MHWLIRDKFIGVLAVISLLVAVLMHFPELLSLVDADPTNLFPGMSNRDVISEVVFTFLSLLLLYGLNLFIFGFNRYVTRISWKKVFLSFLFTWGMSSLLGQTFVFFHHHWGIPAVDAVTHYYLHPLRDFIITCIVVGGSYVLYLIRYTQHVRSENQQLQAESLVHQYEALKSQLNPHMLFNSLNTLGSLIRENPDRAQDYLQELSNVLRYTLQENEDRHVTLKEEMEFVNAFLFLLKMRYEENIIFEIAVDKGLDNRCLPPMSVQLLVENAVKHNEISNRRPLTVRVFTEGNTLTVTNPIQSKRTPYVGTGIGLANLGRRYQLLFKQDIRVQKEEGHFTVTIPLI